MITYPENPTIQWRQNDKKIPLQAVLEYMDNGEYLYVRENWTAQLCGNHIGYKLNIESDVIECMILNNVIQINDELKDYLNARNKNNNRNYPMNGSYYSLTEHAESFLNGEK